METGEGHQSLVDHLVQEESGKDAEENSKRYGDYFVRIRRLMYSVHGPGAGKQCPPSPKVMVVPGGVTGTDLPRGRTGMVAYSPFRQTSHSDSDEKRNENVKLTYPTDASPTADSEGNSLGS